MKEVFLIKNGEIALKGLNRASFEDALMRNIRWRLRDLGKFTITKSQSTITVSPNSDDIDLDEACERIKKIFGIAAFSRALVVEKDLDVIKQAAPDYLREMLLSAKTFKVNARRSDKTFPYTSPQLQQELGATLLSAFPRLKVDVHQPQVTATVEIREHEAYIHGDQIPGAGGLPIPTSGEALLFISGGIDSPVAGYLMSKRGLKLSAIHFESPPYTSERALGKVETLLSKVAEYAGDITFYCVPFTKIQEELRRNCPEELFTILMRRMMVKIANRVAAQANLPAMITGESLGQVASQTILSLAATNAAADRPIFRPLIGMDKSDIVKIARQIDTFETSILPYEDCCTVFTPKRPKTRPSLSYVESAEAAFDFAPLLDEAVENIRVSTIKAY